MSLLRHHQVGENRVLSDRELQGFWKLLNSQLLFVFLIILLLVFLSSFTRDFSHKRSIDGEVFSLKAQIQELEDKHTYELSLINYYESDEYLALEAKSVLDMKLQGEKAVVLLESEVDKILAGQMPFSQDLQKNNNGDNQIEEGIGVLGGQKSWKTQADLWWRYFFN